MKRLMWALAALGLWVATTVHADVDQRTVNDGNVVLEDVPPIAEDVVDALNRYQNVRSADFAGFSADGESVFIRTRFSEVTQIHRVDMAKGARFQLTFFDEPVGGVTRRPHSDELVFTMDAGGNEFSQLFLLDPDTGESTMLTDGESRNGVALFDRSGQKLAFQSTRRNGRSNDVWIMDPTQADGAEIALESPDGAWWGPSAFSRDGE